MEFARETLHEACEVCGKYGRAERHPCRFEIACSCWRGIACKGTGRVKAEQRHTQQVLGKSY